MHYIRKGDKEPIKDYEYIYYKFKDIGYLAHCEINKLRDNNPNKTDDIVFLGKIKHLPGVEIIGVRNNDKTKTIKLDKIYCFKNEELLNSLFNLLKLNDKYIAVKIK